MAKHPLNPDKGLRFNAGKLRFDLVPTSLTKAVAGVLTYGAVKYTVTDDKGKIIVRGDNNWRKGLPWMEVMASHDRHIHAFKNGEDYDPESMLLHIDHALTNLSFIREYYHIHLKGDDRVQHQKAEAKIGLDLDEVVVDWLSTWCKEFGLPRPMHWHFQWDLFERFEKMNKTKQLPKLYAELPPLISPEELFFEPACYISHRPVKVEVSQRWLEKNNFPLKPVFHVESRSQKVDIAKSMELDYFLDDSYDTYKMMNQAGICCFLMDAKHNKKYNVGYKRVHSLVEFKEKIGA